MEGINNLVADALSRVLISAISSRVDYTEMARYQLQDADETLAYRTAVTGLRWEDIPIGNGNLTLLCDVSTGRVRPLVPAALRHKVFDTVHGLSHPGANTTVKLVSSKLVFGKSWPFLQMVSIRFLWFREFAEQNFCFCQNWKNQFGHTCNTQVHTEI